MSVQRAVEEERVTIEVVDSKCAYYQQGDKILVEGPLIIKEKSSRLCLMALQAIFPYVFALRKGVTAGQLGYAEDVVVQCPDYCGPVVFRLVSDRA